MPDTYDEALRQLVIEEITRDIANGDTTAIDELLTFVPTENLVGYLPDNTVLPKKLEDGGYSFGYIPDDDDTEDDRKVGYADLSLNDLRADAEDNSEYRSEQLDNLSREK